MFRVIQRARNALETWNLAKVICQDDRVVRKIYDGSCLAHSWVCLYIHNPSLHAYAPNYHEEYSSIEYSSMYKYGCVYNNYHSFVYAIFIHGAVYIIIDYRGSRMDWK